MKKFCDKHFKGKNMTREEKAYYVHQWIHKKVTYAKGKKYNKIASKTYVDAIFNKKLGQCLQYNGAMAEFLSYLGYQTRIIQGYYGRKGNQHFWCEVKVQGRWYVVETGNEKKNGYWQFFVQPHCFIGSYIKNKKFVTNQ